MSLQQWESEVRPELELIEAGAEMCARHAQRLPLRPDFRTLAEEGLCECEAALARALTKVRLAQAAYRDKRIDR